MPYMELRSTFTSCFFLFLILSLPHFSTGGSEAVESEIYEIDYRGPETHSSTPPPGHSHAAPSSSNHRKTSVGIPKVNKGFKVKRIHG